MDCESTYFHPWDFNNNFNIFIIHDSNILYYRFLYDLNIAQDSNIVFGLFLATIQSKIRK